MINSSISSLPTKSEKKFFKNIIAKAVKSWAFAKLIENQLSEWYPFSNTYAYYVKMKYL